LAHPSVSVLLPVFNAINDLPRSIKSLQNQTFADFEVIVIDDGSTDGSDKYLDQIAKSDNRFQVFHQQNAGSLGKTLNQAAGYAQGMFFARQDADDASHETRLADQVSYLQSHPQIGLCGTWNWHIDTQLGPMFSSEVPDNHSLLLGFLKKGINPFIHGSTMMRAELFRKAGCYRGSMVEDFDLWLRMSEISHLGISQKLGYYYWHALGGISSGSHIRQKKLVGLALKLYQERIRFGEEITSWDTHYQNIRSIHVSESSHESRITSGHYARSIHLMRLKRWDDARTELTLASTGQGQYAAKAKRNLGLFFLAPVVAAIYRFIESHELQRYAKTLPPGTQLPDTLINTPRFTNNET